MGFKELSNLWDRKNKDEQNRMFKEIYDGDFLLNESLPGDVLKKDSVDTPIIKKGAVTEEKIDEEAVTSEKVKKKTLSKKEIQDNIIDKGLIPPKVISPDKTDFFDVSDNLFNINSPHIQKGKGLSGTTNNIVIDSKYNISHKINANFGDKIYLGLSGKEVTDIWSHKVAFYNNNEWLSTSIYEIGGVSVPENTTHILVHYLSWYTDFQVELKQISSYNMYSDPKLNKDFIGKSTIDDKKIKNKSINPFKTDFFDLENNLFNNQSSEIQIGKGFSGSSSNIVADLKYNISHPINVKTRFLIITDDGSSVEKPSYFKVACYKDSAFLTTVYFSNPVVLPNGTNKVLVQYDQTVTELFITDSIPTLKNDVIANDSITIDKTDFFEKGENLLDINASGTVKGKGFSGETNNIVDAQEYNISPYIQATASSSVFVTVNNEKPATPAMFKVAEYNKNGNWLKTTVMYNSFVTLRSDTNTIRIHYNHYQKNIMFSYDSFKNFSEFKQTALKKELLPKELFEDNDFNLYLRFHNKKISMIGDSLIFRNMWQPYVVDLLKLNYSNFGIGSTTMALVPAHEANYPCVINANRLKNLDDTDAFFEVYNGGTNDCHRGVPIGDISEFNKPLDEKNKETFYGAYSYLIEYRRKKNPLINQMMINIPQVDKVKWSGNYKPYNDAIKTIADYYGIPLVDWFSKCGYNQSNVNDFTLDGLHHNENGGKRAANVFLSTIKEFEFF